MDVSDVLTLVQFFFSSTVVKPSSKRKKFCIKLRQSNQAVINKSLKLALILTLKSKGGRNAKISSLPIRYSKLPNLVQDYILEIFNEEDYFRCKATFLSPYHWLLKEINYTHGISALLSNLTPFTSDYRH